LLDILTRPIFTMEEQRNVSKSAINIQLLPTHVRTTGSL